MTITEIETVSLEAHDFEIPCMWKSPRGCQGANPAVWAVWLKVICDHQYADFLYLCEQDKERYISRDFLYCPNATHFVRPSEAIIRLEKIR